MLNHSEYVHIGISLHKLRDLYFDEIKIARACLFDSSLSFVPVNTPRLFNQMNTGL